MARSVRTLVSSSSALPSSASTAPGCLAGLGLEMQADRSGETER